MSPARKGYASLSEVIIVDEKTIECWNCETVFTWTPKKKKTTIYASGVSVKAELPRKYLVPCPQCGEKNKVEV